MITETHITDDIDMAEYQLMNFTTCVCYSDSRHTGGVIMYCHDSIHFRVVSNICFERNWFLALKVENGFKRGMYGLVYHSPNDSDSNFLEFLENTWLESVVESNVDNFIVGDFNINWLNCKDSERLRSVMHGFGLKQVVTESTRCTAYSETMIDLVFSNSSVTDVSVLKDYKISDHETLQIISKEEQDVRNEDTGITIKCWRKYSKEALQALLRSNLPETSERELHEKAEVLGTVLEHCVNQLVVVKSIKCTSHKRWYTVDLKLLKNERDEAYMTASGSWEEQDWERYRVLRNEYSHSVRRAKALYTQRKIEENKNDSRSLWKVLKTLWNSKNRNSKCVKFDGVDIEDESEISEKFNGYFVDSVREIHDSIENVHDDTALNEDSNERWNIFEPVTMENLKKVVNNLNNSSGLNNVNLQVLKDSWDMLGEYLLGVVNESLETGEFPRSWKQSVVIPIQKISGTVKAEEFRPINMLPVYEKVLESIVREQVTAYLNSNEILIAEQSGFRQNHSCESALNLLLYKWKRMLEARKTIVVIFLDLKRAFETISRPMMLKTLKKYGLGGNVLKWFESYLNDRTQVCRYGEKVSSPLTVPLGVPQGSVLGPLLFIMYINDVKAAIGSCELNLFADDTVIFFGSKDPKEALQKIREGIVQITKWLRIKKLKLNVQKTKMMIISNKRNLNLNEFNVDIEEELIERVQEFKYLGVKIDDKLNFKVHIDYVISKIAKKHGILSRLRGKLPFWSKIFLYKTLIAPHIDYCSSILFLASETQIKRLQRLQNRQMRFILQCNKYTPIRMMLDTLQWLSVKERIVFNVLTIIYKMTQDLLPEYLRSILVSGNDIHEHRTRRINDLRVVPFSMTSTQRSIYYKGIKMFNSLPGVVKTARTVPEFKRGCVQWIRVNYR